MMPFPKLSPAFTVEDIRKVRDWYGVRYANMSRKEIIEDVNSGARVFAALIENERLAKKQAEYL